MALQTMRSGVFSAFFILLLVGGGLGLILMDWTGSYSHGGGPSYVAEVEGERIGVTQFDQMIRPQLRSMNLTADAAYKNGVINELLQAEIMKIVMAYRAHGYGIQVNDTLVANEIKKQLDPLVAQFGGNHREALSELLRVQGLSEAQLVEAIRQDMQNKLLRDSFMTGSYVPAVLTQDLAKFLSETRTVRFITLKDSNVGSYKAPSEQDLAAFYQKVQAQFMPPQTRDLVVGILDTQKIAQNAAVTETDIQNYYEQNADQFKKEEQRRISQVIVKTKEEAEKIAKVSNLKDQKDHAVQALTVQKKDLPSALAESVFAANLNEKTKPIETPLGFHVVQIDEVIPAKTLSLDEASESIKTELSKSLVSDKIFEVSKDIEDRLANNETLEQLKKDYPLDVKTLPKISLNTQNNSNLDFLGDAKSALMEQAFSLNQDEYSSFVELNANKMAILGVQKIYASVAPPLANVKDRLLPQYETLERARLNMEQATKWVDQLNKGATTLEKLAQDQKLPIQTASNISRQDAQHPDLSSASLETLINLDEKKFAVGASVGQVQILTVDKISVPEKPIEAEQVKNLQQNLEMVEPLTRFDAYMKQAMKDGNVKINEALLERTYGQNEEYAQ
jgi:peptidyl-prolyl cis-trans isomerase D